MRALFVCTLALLTPLPASAGETPLRDLQVQFEGEMLLDGRPTGPVPEGRLTEPESEEAIADSPPAAAGTRDDQLDRLFADLKRTASPERAKAIARQIQTLWLTNDSATVELLMGWAGLALLRAENGTVFDLTEQVMLLDPGYAESWNMRATLNFRLSQYGRSLADIEQTLAREPRHFGALMGLGAILEEMGRPEQALGAYQRVLAIYPAQRDAQDAVGRLASEVGDTTL